jgi:hypothetical protein
MDITVIIPTLKRQYNGYAYLEDSLRHNAKTLGHKKIFADKFLYFSECDFDEVSQIAAHQEFQFVYRPVHRELANIDNGSYDFWRMHLCLDFCHSMKQVMSCSPSSYFMWLEDDTLLSDDFAAELKRFFKANTEIHMASPYHTMKYGGCAACLLFERQALVEYISHVEKWCAQSIPLDYFYKFHSREILPFRRKIAFHAGKHSSRPDGDVLRAEEFPPKPKKRTIRSVFKRG